MAKLTDTQLIVLSKAARWKDGAARVPERMNKAAAAKVGASLVVRRLMREIRAKPGMTVWRMDDDGRRISLIITRAVTGDAYFEQCASERRYITYIRNKPKIGFKLVQAGGQERSVRCDLLRARGTKWLLFQSHSARGAAG